MRRLTTFCLCLAALLWVGLTRVAAEEMPRPEYPRPQFERSQWLCLNGTWTYAFDFGRTGLERDWHESKGFDGRITVPFCPESQLSGVGYTDFIPSL